MITNDSSGVVTSNNEPKNLRSTAPASSNALPPPIWLGGGGRRLRDPRIVRASRALGGKDRHSKVCTARGLRDRRVRLSVQTAIQLYDLQDRLGLNQPSKVVDWLLNAAKEGIDELPPLQVPQGFFTHHFQSSLVEPSKPIIMSRTKSTVSIPAGESGVYSNPFLENPNSGLIFPPSHTLGSTVQIDCDFSNLPQLPLSGFQHNFQPGISSQPCFPPQICGNNNSTTRSNDLFSSSREMVGFSSSQMLNSLPHVYHQFTSQPSAAAVVGPIFPFTMSPNFLPWQKHHGTEIEKNKGSHKFLS